MSFPAAKLLVVCCVAAGLVLAAAPRAEAQSSTTTTSTKHPVPPDVKGTLGLGLIGAELGFVLPAVAGMNDTWAFIVFPLVGAAGGAAAGYFALEQGGHTDLSVAALTAGMALLIPALVITVSETAYDPEDDEADVGTARIDTRDPRTAGTGMLRVAERGIAVGAPAVGFVSDADGSGLAAARITGAELSVLSGRF